MTTETDELIDAEITLSRCLHDSLQLDFWYLCIPAADDRCCRYWNGSTWASMRPKKFYSRDSAFSEYRDKIAVENVVGDDKYRELVRRAITGLKRLGEFTYDRSEYQEPHSLDCSHAGRVSRVFCTGMTRSIELCREFGFDPDYRESDEYKKEDE